MEMVWEKQLKDIIVVAGFEIYDAEITPHYIFTKPQDTAVSQVEETTNSTLYDYSPKLSSIPYSDTGLKEKYTFDNFIPRGWKCLGSIQPTLAVSEDFGLDL